MRNAYARRHEREIVSKKEYLILEDYTRKLFQRGTEIAAERGLILVDTKYEFGKTKEGKIVLIDEIHTPDSSRYFYQEGYEQRQAKGESQKQLSKEFVRQWLIENGFQGKDNDIIPEMTDQNILELLNELILDFKEQNNLKKIESLEKKLINNLDENSYSELIELKSQLNRD